ncbi:MAG: hypothetical protein KGJ93_00080 [Patescibacteria group bacterium]|nr:hypothetical protein [Patescibacteria group bacterium]
MNEIELRRTLEERQREAAAAMVGEMQTQMSELAEAQMLDACIDLARQELLQCSATPLGVYEALQKVHKSAGPAQQLDKDRLEAFNRRLAGNIIEWLERVTNIQVRSALQARTEADPKTNEWKEFYKITAEVLTKMREVKQERPVPAASDLADLGIALEDVKAEVKIPEPEAGVDVIPPGGFIDTVAEEPTAEEPEKLPLFVKILETAKENAFADFMSRKQDPKNPFPLEKLRQVFESLWELEEYKAKEQILEALKKAGVIK